MGCSVLDDQKSVIASVQVKNHSNVGGETVVQLYIHDQAGTVARPVKELIDFKRISLQPGEEKTVEFVITEKQLRYYDCNMHYVTEPGMFDIYAGLDSEHVLKEQLEYQTSY